MLKPKILAYAVTIVFAVAYTTCGIVAYFFPDLFWYITNSWFHAINLETVKSTTPVNIGTFSFGVITFSIYVWVLVYAGAALYNYLLKEHKTLGL